MIARARRKAVVIGAAAVLAFSGTTVAMSVTAAAAAGGPDAWAAACSASALGLGDDTVARAPVLSLDSVPGGGPVRNSPDAAGKWYPIVLVHGWTSQDTVANAGDRSGAFSHRIDLSSNPVFSPQVTRSFVGQLQGLPGAAVFTFDYHPYSARWVDDEHLGPALGKVIDCLYKASTQKVVLVAHSMGGLISRWAATHPGVTGADRSGEISTAVTFGTPETGSVAALLGEVGVDVGAATNDALAVIRLILSVCGTLSSNEIETGTLCDVLPAPVRTFESDAGIALRSGSPQLAALKPWPHGIYVDALAGNTSFEVPKAGWFQWPWATDKVSGPGDMIVTQGSALSGADGTRAISCDYQLDPVRGATDQLGLLFSLTARSEVAGQPLAALTGPCFHTSLMRDIELTNEALGAVHDDLAGRVPEVTTATLKGAQVPADCRLPAQRLTNGHTTKGSPGEGWINSDKKTIGYNDFAGLGYKQALTEYGCTAGGVGWPDVLVLIGAGGALLASYDLGKHDGQEHSAVSSVTPTGNAAEVTWTSYEGAGSYFVHHQARVSYASGTLLLANDVATYTPVAVAEDIASAQYEKRRSFLKDPNVITDDMWAELVGTYRSYIFTVGFTDCPTAGNTAVCDISFISDSGGERTGTMTLTRSPGTLYGWRVTDLTL